MSMGESVESVDNITTTAQELAAFQEDTMKS